jgi:TonB-dependent SusC/RagA subfamily outer membrane receptor
MTAPFLLSWLAVSAAMSLVIAVAALAMQRLASRAIPSRLIWATAMVAMIGVSATQPLRRAPSTERIDGPLGATTMIAGVEIAAPTPLEALLASLRQAPVAAMDRLIATAGAAGRTLPPNASRALLFLWPLTTLTLAGILLFSYRRQRALLRRAAPHTMAGTLVHVSEQTGPAVIGAAEPAIVVPRWLLHRTDDEQRLVVAHEAAHIAARDPQLLLAGCAAVTLMPWNPAAWFALSRLRLAIELDCDARVLARGTDTRRYGQLLIELSAAAPHPAIPLGAPAFSYRASHLERRLRTMTARPARFLAARRLSALFVGSAALLAACGAELPTSTELQGMDVAKVETRLGKMVQIDSANTRYLVNGRVVEERLARGLAADSIATIEVRKVGRKANEIRIATKGAPISGTVREVQVANATGKDGPVVVVRGMSLTERPVSGVVVRTDSTRGEPLIFIDGVKAATGAMDKLSHDRIESIEVLKGATGLALYGSEGSNGVIRITLKK